MRCDDQTRQPHGDQALTKGPDRDHDRHNAAFFQQPGDVSDGHVTDRSGRHEQRGIHLLLLQDFVNELHNYVGILRATPALAP